MGRFCEVCLSAVEPKLRLKVRLLSRLTDLNLELSLLCVPVSLVATLGILLVQVKAI